MAASLPTEFKWHPGLLYVARDVKTGVRLACTKQGKAVLRPHVPGDHAEVLSVLPCVGPLASLTDGTDNPAVSVICITGPHATLMEGHDVYVFTTQGTFVPLESDAAHTAAGFDTYTMRTLGILRGFQGDRDHLCMHPASGDPVIAANLPPLRLAPAAPTYPGTGKHARVGTAPRPHEAVVDAGRPGTVVSLAVAGVLAAGGMAGIVMQFFHRT
jgi:hypothetical protein